MNILFTLSAFLHFQYFFSIYLENSWRKLSHWTIKYIILWNETQNPNNTFEIAILFNPFYHLNKVLSFFKK